MKDSTMTKCAAILYSVSAIGFLIAAGMYFVADMTIFATTYIVLSLGLWAAVAISFQTYKIQLRDEDLQERNRKRAERLEKLEEFFDDRLDRSPDEV